MCVNIVKQARLQEFVNKYYKVVLLQNVVQKVQKSWLQVNTVWELSPCWRRENQGFLNEFITFIGAAMIAYRIITPQSLIYIGTYRNR